MSAPSTFFWRLGCASGASAVLLGAFGAHGLQARFAGHPDREKLLSTWHTASSYHLVHSGILLIAASQRKQLAAQLLAGGIAVFSGSLYALVLSGVKVLGAVTPIGGLLLVGGWAAMLL